MLPNVVVLLLQEGYCSDMSRTWSVDSKPTPQQEILIEIVSWVQKTIYNRLLRLGNDYGAYPTLDNLYHQMLELLGRQLRQRNIILPKSTETSKDAALVCSTTIGDF